MPLQRALFDTAVFVYAVGTDHPYREPCRRLVEALGGQHVHAEASVELVQEFLHQRARRTGDRPEAVRLAQRVAALCTLHEVEVRDLRLALDLFAAHDALHARDAVHAATAINRGITSIVSPDRAFDDLDGLVRIDPRDAADQLA